MHCTGRQPRAILAWEQGEPTCVEDKRMRVQGQWCSVLVTAMLIGLVGVTTKVVAAGEQFLPVLSTREGPTGR